MIEIHFILLWKSSFHNKKTWEKWDYILISQSHFITVIFKLPPIKTEIFFIAATLYIFGGKNPSKNMQVYRVESEN